ncbi:phosphatidylinositol 3,4,5-trisphosphate 5-phosphatase 2A-like [Protopterus annectens]|uniref:phosphatidylinositol 3,4,5-trisphosphate 5-phosphatase 2A-like n=1 Tax=Protopterus annectens TaxID=7888 RepID=UPI001CFBFBB0|nr:phosphatidylinositol 3,4,5-trisphosphate 5-phosphatase 2A-like [Protopterus annectens]
MCSSPWYHRDISRVRAEDLLAKAGKDGSFLVRDSESVQGAYALCLLFQRQVHTYRILPDEGLLAVQSMQGMQVKCFRTLNDLVAMYQQPNKGLVIPLLHPVFREKENLDDGSDGEDDRPYCPPGNTVSKSGSSFVSNKSHILLQLQQKLQDHCNQSTANEFEALIIEYLRSDVQQDLDALRNGNVNLKNLSKVMGTAFQPLQSELDFTLLGLETLAKVFDLPPYSPLSPQNKQGISVSGEMDLEILISKISAVKNILSSLEKKVLKSLQDTISSHNLATPSIPVGVLTSEAPKALSIQTFEVKIGKSQKVLMVDVDGGKISILKKSGNCLEENIHHQKIRQLVKYQGIQNKLKLIIDRDAQKNQQKELIFEDARKREAFCQLMQLTKMKHANLDEPDWISIYIGTWNMGNSPPAKNIASWLTSRGLGRCLDETTAYIPHDIYVFGTQENSLGDREWVEYLKTAIRGVTGIDFKLLATQSLWNIKIGVFVKPEYENRISHVNTSSVKTGYANTLGNKGAVGVSFLFNGTSFGFVNCHLTSGNDKTLRRNQNHHDIVRSLLLGDKQLSAFDITLRFTHLFWLGDLNYRIDMDAQDILNHINKKNLDALLSVDQLTLEREKNKAFLRFNEEEITFPPTYRYDRGTRDSYAWQKFKTTGVKINVPSWCDRILWKSYPETYFVCKSYGCTDDVMSSDHSPVFATYEVGVTSQFVSKKDPGSNSEMACIEFENIEAIVKTASKTKFFIEFHSSCLEEYQKSSENSSQSCEISGFLKLGWSAKQLPMLIPIVSDMEYLQDQHILLSIKSMDGYESYGECCIALKSMIGSLAQQFETFLSHRSEETGSVRGWMKVQVPKERRGTRERIYEWISLVNDDRRPTSDPSEAEKNTQNLARSRSVGFTAPPNASSYTNAAYFIFEGTSSSGFTEESSNTSSKEVQPSKPASMLYQMRTASSVQHRSDPPQHPSIPEREKTNSPHYKVPKNIPQEKDHSNHSVYQTVKEKKQRAVPLIRENPQINVSMAQNKGATKSVNEKSKSYSCRAGWTSESSGTLQERTADDQSRSVLQMAKSLSDVEFQQKRNNCSIPLSQQQVKKSPLLPRPNNTEIRTALPRSGYGTRTETTQMSADNRTGHRELLRDSSGQKTIGQWLSEIGLEIYETSLHQKGWDNLKFIW